MLHGRTGVLFPVNTITVAGRPQTGYRMPDYDMRSTIQHCFHIEGNAMGDSNQAKRDTPAGRLERRKFLKAAAAGGLLLSMRVAAAAGSTADVGKGAAAEYDRRLADLVYRCGAELGVVRTIDGMPVSGYGQGET